MNSRQKSEGEIDAEESTWSSIKRKLDGFDKFSGSGVALAAAWGAMETDLLPDEDNILGDSSRGEYLFNEYVLGEGSDFDGSFIESAGSLDKVGHYGISYLAAKSLCNLADRGDDYDSKKVAAVGLAAVPIYFAVKEGYIEGSGFDPDFSSTEQMADLVADTLGAIHATYNFHKERTAQGDKDFNVLTGDAMHSLGRAYGKFTNYFGSKEHDGGEEDEIESMEDVYSR
ncbi:hypothetical protein GLU64_01190 [Nanohaloarchaea archaeon]|nr:hypothetical protein [Candidatus Nanohaloarchaea archaeon]